MDETGVTFVNGLLGRGVFNGNVNLTFGTYLFTPQGDETSLSIDPDMVVSARLRMDIAAARQLYASLGELLDSVNHESAPVAEEAEASGVATEVKH